MTKNSVSMFTEYLFVIHPI